jgi:hypothetical protein
MPIIARGTETYLLITGVQTDTTVQLGPHTELLPATCHLNYDEFASMMKDSYLDFAVGLLVIPLVRSQLHVTADDAKQLAQRAWNAQWDCLLLSALFDQTVLWNVQSDVPAEMIDPRAAINISNYHLSGFHIKGEYELTTSDKEWLEKHFKTARTLLANPSFQTAAHSLASFRWHTHARAQLALIWSGIEALFGIESEIVFRVSLYTARFLEPDDETERLKVFAKVKSLYKHRSAAVHGSKIKGDAGLAVKDSAELLRRLVRQCSEMNQLPDIQTLVP